MSALLGRNPPVSRWVWLGLSAVLFASGVVLFELWLGPVTFNDGEMTTAWSFLLSTWCMLMFLPCVLVTLALRAIDAARARTDGRVPYVAWWLLGVLIVTAYGARLGWEAEVVGTSPTFPTASIGVGLLAIAGVGSLIAIAAIRALRRTSARAT